MRSLSLGLVVLAAVWAVPARAADAAKADKFFFKDGDVVVMIGDSITEQYLYSSYVEMWTTTRFPAWKLTFRNTGIGGDRSTGGNGRFPRDVLRYHPTAMTVDFGMNDGNYQPFDGGAFKTYMSGLQGMADQAKAAKVRVAWVTPQPRDTAEPSKTAMVDYYNDTLEKFSAGVKEVAQKNDGLFVDQFHPYLAALNRARGEEEKYNRITGGDAVHPGPPGQALMAASILKGMSFPKLVASVEIDLLKSRAEPKATNCKVSDLTSSADRVSFTQLDQALPFFPPEAASILKWAPILDELNQYRLKVTNLKDGKYDVRVGGNTVATYGADELAKGVNLAPAVLLQDPKKANLVLAQVLAVKDAIEKKNKYFKERIFRGVVLAPVQVPDWLGVKLTGQEIEKRREAALEERMAKMPDLDDAIRKTLEMKPHTVEVVPAK